MSPVITIFYTTMENLFFFRAVASSPPSLRGPEVRKIIDFSQPEETMGPRGPGKTAPTRLLYQKTVAEDRGPCVTGAPLSRETKEKN